MYVRMHACMYVSVQDASFCYLIPGKACDPASSQASAPRQASQPLKVGSASVARHRSLVIQLVSADS